MRVVLQGHGSQSPVGPLGPGDPLASDGGLGLPLIVSLAVHAAIAAAILFTAFFRPSREPFMGERTTGAGVAVTAVKTIPIPQKSGQINHLANDTESTVPQEPLKVKQLRPPEPRAPEKAIELPTRNPIKPQPRPSNPVQYRPRQDYAKNQVFSQTPQALKSEQFGVQGGGGVGIGPSTPFGYQFGAYAQQIRDLVRAKWNQAGISASPTAIATVSIRIMRDGSVSVINTQTSGSYTLDTSARRAVLDASPLPPLPPGFPRSQADVDLLFQLRR